MIIKLLKSLYSKEVLLKTAYGLTDRVFLHLDQDEKYWLVSWEPREGQALNAGELENELIAQSLRADLLKQTADLRKIILARAFASTVLDDHMDSPSSCAFNMPACTSEDATLITEEEKKSILRGWSDQE